MTTPSLSLFIRMSDDASLRRREQESVCAFLKTHQITPPPVIAVFITGVVTSSAVADVLGTLREDFDITSDADITVEIEAAQVADIPSLLSAGATRYSLKNADTVDVVALHLPAEGNIDFCYRGNDDDPARLYALLGCGAAHVSLYEAEGLSDDADTQEKLVATHETLERLLESQAYVGYDLYHFARAGSVSRHQQHLLRGGDYLGFGAGAVSRMGDGRGQRWARQNPADNARWTAAILHQDANGSDGFFIQAPADHAREILQRGLPARDGVDGVALRPFLDMEKIAFLVEHGDVTWDKTTARLCVTAAARFRIESLAAYLIP